MMSETCPPHHEIITTPDGPIVEGTCKKCGNVRIYDSAGPEEKHVYRRGYPTRHRETELEAYGFPEEG